MPVTAVQPLETVFVSSGAQGAGLSYANTTATGYRMFVAPCPIYVYSMTVHNDNTSTPAGTLQAGYENAAGVSAALLTTTNFGEATANNAQRSVELPIAVSGTTDDQKPLLLPAGAVIGFNTSAAVTSAGPKLLGVTIRFRRVG